MECPRCHERLPLSARACHACGALAVRSAVPAPLPVTEGGAVTVTVDATPLRDRPFASARVVMQLRRGDRLTTGPRQWDYLPVDTPDGRRGFVHVEAVSAAREEQPAAGPATDAAAAAHGPAAPPEDPASLPFNIPLLADEQVLGRAVFLYNPLNEQHLVLTNRRLIIAGGALGSLPRVLFLEEIDAVRLLNSGSGATSGEGSLFLTVNGIANAIQVGGVHTPQRLRDEIVRASAAVKQPKPRTRRASA